MRKALIHVVDYGIGNVGSVINMIHKIGAEGRITRDPHEIEKSSKLIIPGVGAFDRGISALHSFHLVDAITFAACVKKIPVLGICLGMQMMTRGSEEGISPGLGWVQADTLKFSAINALKIPHMGWNQIKPTTSTRLFDITPEELERFYFVHSYYVRMDLAADVAATCHYGHDFTAAFQVGNLLGVQFHPEKSHLFGMNFFRRFVAI